MEHGSVRKAFCKQSKQKRSQWICAINKEKCNTLRVYFHIPDLITDVEYGFVDKLVFPLQQLLFPNLKTLGGQCLNKLRCHSNALQEVKPALVRKTS